MTGLKMLQTQLLGSEISPSKTGAHLILLHLSCAPTTECLSLHCTGEGITWCQKSRPRKTDDTTDHISLEPAPNSPRVYFYSGKTLFPIHRKPFQASKEKP